MADDLIVTDEVLADPLVLARLLRDIIERLGNDVDSVNTQTIINRTVTTISGSTGSALEVEDSGVSLSTAVTKLNFQGFFISEPVANELTIRIGPAGASDVYSPGYNYTRLSTTTFTIDLVNALALFRTGRRIKFGRGGLYTYGVVASGDYNSTHPNDTFITMTMEGTNTIPSTIDELYLVSSDSSWSPIASDPFGGTAIRGIATGPISSTQWWVAVGDGGKLFTSTDAGVTWTSRTSGTTGDLLCVTYDSNSEEFIIGGSASAAAGSYLAKSTNGSTWSSITIPWSNAANDYIKSIGYSYTTQYHCVSHWDDSAGFYDPYVSTNTFSTVTSRASNVTATALVASARSLNAANAAWYYVNGVSAFVYQSVNDAGASFTHSHSGIITALGYDYNAGASANRLFTGSTTGNIIVNNTLDDVTFSNAIRDFAVSEMHERTVCVGDSGTIGYLPDASIGSVDSWVSVSNGFDPTANVLCVDFNETNGVFIACADNGQICRSSTGIT